MKSNHVSGRTPSFSRNMNLESLLTDINSSLWVAEKNLLDGRGGARFPLVLVMGPMRSGTTLFMQWLANTGLIAYPTNLLSRFYQAPIIGSKVQKLLTDPEYNYRDELGEFCQQAEYQSDNGKTKGVLAPNEFWYFWRRFLSEPSRDVWSDEELRKTMDTDTMVAELSGVMDVFQKPFAAKGMLFNYNIPFLDSVFDKVLFVHIKRDPVANVASVLDARTRQLGDDSKWYSFKIAEYDDLEALAPIEQAAGQVHYINRAIEKGLSHVDSSRKLTVQYEDFCNEPALFYNLLMDKIGIVGCDYKGPESFRLSRNVPKEKEKVIESALDQF